MHEDSEGIVIELRGDNALVMPTKKMGCTEVHCCQGSGVKRVNVLMLNPVNAKLGDRVEFFAKESNMLKAAFVVYVMPLLFILVGALVGYQKLGPAMNWNPSLTGFILGAVGFVIAVFIIKAYDNYAANSPGLKPSITSIIESAEDQRPKEEYNFDDVKPNTAG